MQDQRRKIIGQRVSLSRSARGLTQGELGGLLGLGASATSTISRIENGGTFGLDRLLDLADALNVDPADLAQADPGPTRGQLALVIAACLGGADVAEALLELGFDRETILAMARHESGLRRRQAAADGSAETTAGVAA
ncbi:MAG: helix-turn-helix transcriptional regulator [Myxococcales bacterium]|nr:helix-turn-helix transcriptional regulator [Myxococcales bacterium]